MAGISNLIRGFGELTKNMRDFDKEIKNATKSEQENLREEKKLRDERISGITAGLTGGPASILQNAAMQSLSNPYMSFGQAVTGQVAGGIGLLGGGAIGMTGAERAGQRVGDILELMAAGGAKPTEEQAKDLQAFFQPIETRKAAARALAEKVSGQAQIGEAVKGERFDKAEQAFIEIIEKITNTFKDMDQFLQGLPFVGNGGRG